MISKKIKRQTIDCCQLNQETKQTNIASDVMLTLDSKAVSSHLF